MVLIVIIAVVVGAFGWFGYNALSKKHKTSTPGAYTSTAAYITTTPGVTTRAPVKPRQLDLYQDAGWPDTSKPVTANPTLCLAKRGWYDVTGQGVANDYCRCQGDADVTTGATAATAALGRLHWSCGMAGGVGNRDFPITHSAFAGQPSL